MRIEKSATLDSLLPLQKELDLDIQKRHDVTYESTHLRRLLALLVELGELANETRCFKFWSYKGMSEKEKVLDEYADGLHFLLSLGVSLGVEGYTHVFKEPEEDLTKGFLVTYQKVLDLVASFEPKRYAMAFSSYLNLLPLLGFSIEEAVEAYEKKLAVNHQRQEERY